MPLGSEFSEKKVQYFEKVNELLDKYSKMLLVNVDNVQSQQMHKVRIGLRGKAEILMGKNTRMRKVMAMRASREGAREIDKQIYQKIVQDKALVGNLGIVFTNGDFKPVVDVIRENRVQAPARVGSVAPLDVVIKAGNTGLEPGMTNFFQALGIPTKIVKGTVEISADKKVVSTGEKVDNSVAVLLQKLGIKPFFYGLDIRSIFDNGAVYGPEILEIGDEFFEDSMKRAVSNIACASLALEYPTEASYPHIVMNAFKNLLAVSLGTTYDFDEFDGKTIKKNVLEGKTAAKAASPKKGAASPKKGAAPAPVAAPPEEEGDEDMGLGLFD